MIRNHGFAKFSGTQAETSAETRLYPFRSHAAQAASACASNKFWNPVPQLLSSMSLHIDDWDPCVWHKSDHVWSPVNYHSHEHCNMDIPCWCHQQWQTRYILLKDKVHVMNLTIKWCMFNTSLVSINPASKITCMIPTCFWPGPYLEIVSFQSWLQVVSLWWSFMIQLQNCIVFHMVE